MLLFNYSKLQNLKNKNLQFYKSSLPSFLIKFNPTKVLLFKKLDRPVVLDSN